VVIDLVCFRRRRHQEQDTLAITQPLMYRAISGHPVVRTLYAKKLVDERVVTAEDAEKYVHDYRERLDTAQTVEEKKPADKKRRSHLAATARWQRWPYQITRDPYQTMSKNWRSRSRAFLNSTRCIHSSKSNSARREMAEGKRAGNVRAGISSAWTSFFRHELGLGRPFPCSLASA
jgi:2-oxoglutarate dehydrogenase complex dehydrogenase (E1) component-like enzyme